MYKKLTIIGLVVTTIFLAGSLCEAEDKVHLQADSITYDYDQQIVSASGKTVIKYKDLTIAARHAFISIQDNQLEADGNIEIRRGDEQYYGDHLTYDFKEDKGVLQPLNLQLKTDGMKGTLFGKADQVEIQGDNIIIHNGTFTTCDLDKPHYRIGTREMDYYPDDRLVFYGATYYEGNVPLLYWPYLFISLKDRDSNFLMPVVGRDAEMGWFLILGYRFYLGEHRKGILYFDWMSLLGRRYRWQETFQWNDKDKITAELGLLENKVTGNDEASCVVQLDKDLADRWQLSTYWKWFESTRYETINGISTPTPELADNIMFGLNIQEKNGGSAVRLIYNDEATERYLSLTPSVVFHPFKTATFSLSGSWSDTYYKTSASESVYYGLNLRYNQQFNRYLGLSLNHRFTSYGKTATDTLSLSLPARRWGWFAQTRFSSDLTYQLNSSPLQEGYRLGANLTATSAPIYETPDRDLQVTAGWSLKERIYWADDDPEDNGGYEFFDQFAANVGIKVNKKITEHLSGEASLGWTETTSFTGFTAKTYIYGLTDQMTPGLGLTYKLGYNLQSFNAVYTGEYNISGGIWGIQTLNAIWRPNQESGLNLYFNYYPGMDSFSGTLALVYNPDAKTRLRLNYGYSSYGSGASNLDLQVDLERPINHLWTFDIHARYDLYDKFIYSATAGLAYDWHCRKVVFSYDAVREQFMIQLLFKAFPAATIGLSNQSDYFWNWFNEVVK